MTSYSWNIFRYIADYTHVSAVLILIYFIYRKNGSTDGFSFKTQLMFFIIFCARYLDLILRTQTAYLVFFKLLFIISSGYIVFGLFKPFQITKNIEKPFFNFDTFPTHLVALPCLIFAFLWAPRSIYGDEETATMFSSLLHLTVDVAWAFSEYFEAFAMVPQYVYNYNVLNYLTALESGPARDKINSAYRHGCAFIYICMIGTYRIFYAINWIYKRSMMGSRYVDYTTWIGGIVDIILFLDFLSFKVFKTKSSSLVSNFVLKIDAKMNKINDSFVELGALPNHLHSKNISNDSVPSLKYRGGQVIGNENSEREALV